MLLPRFENYAWGKRGVCKRSASTPGVETMRSLFRSLPELEGQTVTSQQLRELWRGRCPYSVKALATTLNKTMGGGYVAEILRKGNRLLYRLADDFASVDCERAGCPYQKSEGRFCPKHHAEHEAARLLWVFGELGLAGLKNMGTVKDLARVYVGVGKDISYASY